MIPVAKAVGSNSIVRGQGIVHPLGDSALSLAEEQVLRRKLVQQALDALASEAGSGG